MLNNPLSFYAGKRVLLLQGPMGSFFSRFAKDLRANGAHTVQVVFNGGDTFFSPQAQIYYRGNLASWPARLKEIIQVHKIDVVFLFGERRPIHLCVRGIAREFQIELGVFEEGYIRPDYVTLERFGVNGSSPLPRNSLFYKKLDDLAYAEKTLWVGNTYWAALRLALLYHFAYVMLWPWFASYIHHRKLSGHELFCWLRSWVRKPLYKVLERRNNRKFLGKSKIGDYYVCPLQLREDSQMRVYSEYNCVRDFIAEVCTSFARHAPSESYLIIKQHPLDRGHVNYAKDIACLSRTLGVQDRVVYLHDCHLPTLLHSTLGVVTVNSTVGLSALHHQRPLKVCGETFYDIEGLTYQGRLDNFWMDCFVFKPDMQLFKRFKQYLIANSQLNGSFYKPLASANTRCGLVWPHG